MAEAEVCPSCRCVGREANEWRGGVLVASCPDEWHERTSVTIGRRPTMGDFTDPTAQELDMQSDGLKAQAEGLRADAKYKIARAEALEEAARQLWHRGYTLDRAAEQAASARGT